MGGEEDSNLLRADFPDCCCLPLSFTPPKPPTQPVAVCFLCIIRPKTDYTHNYTRFLPCPQSRIISKIQRGFLFIFTCALCRAHSDLRDPLHAWP